jgi:hypothetical protein
MKLVASGMLLLCLQDDHWSSVAVTMPTSRFPQTT